MHNNDRAYNTTTKITTKFIKGSITHGNKVNHQESILEKNYKNIHNDNNNYKLNNQKHNINDKFINLDMQDQQKENTSLIMHDSIIKIDNAKINNHTYYEGILPLQTQFHLFDKKKEQNELSNPNENKGYDIKEYVSASSCPEIENYHSINQFTNNNDDFLDIQNFIEEAKSLKLNMKLNQELKPFLPQIILDNDLDQASINKNDQNENLINATKDNTMLKSNEYRNLECDELMIHSESNNTNNPNIIDKNLNINENNTKDKVKQCELDSSSSLSSNLDNKNNLECQNENNHDNDNDNDKEIIRKKKVFKVPIYKKSRFYDQSQINTSKTEVFDEGYRHQIQQNYTHEI